MHELRANVFRAGARIASADRSLGKETVLGVPFAEKALREKAEEELRACARAANTPLEKIAFVDAANAVRPLTLF
jgi:hypothetical protein